MRPERTGDLEDDLTYRGWLALRLPLQNRRQTTIMMLLGRGVSMRTKMRTMFRLQKVVNRDLLQEYLQSSTTAAEQKNPCFPLGEPEGLHWNR